MNRALATIFRSALVARQVWLKIRMPSLRRENDTKDEFYRRLWRSAAAKMGAEFVELGRGLCEIRLGQNVTRVLRGMVMLDDPVTLKVAGDKALTHQLLSRAGLPVPEHCEFTVANFSLAEEFLLQHEPCVVKPACDTGAGDGVTANVRGRSMLRRAALSASLHAERLLIERQIAGDSYRLLFLDGILLHALHRMAPSVIGDGVSTVRSLIEAENFRRSKGNNTAVTRIHIDEDLKNTVSKHGYTMTSIPPAGAVVPVKTVVNDNARRDNVDVTDSIGEALRAECALAAQIVGARLAAVDVITCDPQVSLKQSGGAIIEINTTPGLHHHYNVRNPDERRDIAAVILEYILSHSERSSLREGVWFSSRQ